MKSPDRCFHLMSNFKHKITITIQEEFKNVKIKSFCCGYLSTVTVRIPYPFFQIIFCRALGVVYSDQLLGGTHSDQMLVKKCSFNEALFSKKNVCTQTLVKVLFHKNTTIYHKRKKHIFPSTSVWVQTQKISFLLNFA